MLSLKERIDLLEEDLKSSPPAFAMSAELPFAILRYDPSLSDENEWAVRKEIQKLGNKDFEYYRKESPYPFNG